MRKGISEIVSSALILAIAVSVAGVYAQWAPDFSENTTENIAGQSENQIKCSNAAFNIEGAKYDITGELAEFNLSNKGTINFFDDITVAAINSSRITKQKTIGELEVEETQRVDLDSNKTPDKIIASSKDCPELKVVEDQITVSN